MRIASLILMTALLASPYAAGIAPDADVINRLPIEEKFGLANRSYMATGRASVLSLLDALDKLYEVPICIDWPYGDIPALFEVPPDIDFVRDQPLGRVLADISEISQGYVRYERISGILAVVPAIPAPSEDRPLDRVISLDLNDVSTWEAFLAVAEAANSAEPDGRRLVIQPGPATLGRQPPVGLVQEPTVTIRASNITAREAICEIIAKSPLELSYFAYHSDIPKREGQVLRLANVQISFYMNGRQGYMVESMGGAEIGYWDDIRAYMAGHDIEKPAPFWKTSSVPQSEVPEEVQRDAITQREEPEVPEPAQPMPATPQQAESENRTSYRYVILAGALILLIAAALLIRRRYR